MNAENTEIAENAEAGMFACARRTRRFSAFSASNGRCGFQLH
jgi:hypothetical protein